MTRAGDTETIEHARALHEVGNLLVGAGLARGGPGVPLLVAAWKGIPAADRRADAVRALAAALRVEAERLGAGVLGRWWRPDDAGDMMLLDRRLVDRLRELGAHDDAAKHEAGARTRWAVGAVGERGAVAPWLVRLSRGDRDELATLARVVDVDPETGRVEAGAGPDGLTWVWLWNEAVKRGRVSAAAAVEAGRTGDLLHEDRVAPELRDAVRALDAEIVAAAGDTTARNWTAPRWIALAGAVWPTVKAELVATAAPVVVMRRWVINAATRVARGREGVLPADDAARGGLVWAPPAEVSAVQRELLDRCRADAGEVVRSIHSGRLLRAMAKHGRRGDGRALVVPGGWAAVAQMLGFSSGNDLAPTRQAATFWDAVRLTRPDDSLSVRVLMSEHGTGADGRPVVKLTPGEALMWHDIAKPRDYAAVRPVPVPDLMPPWALDRRYRGAEAWAQLELVALLTERAEEYKAKGGVQMTPADWRSILDAVGVPIRTERADVIAKLSEGWAARQEQGHLLPFITLDGDRVALAPAHDAVAEFIVTGGARRGRAAKARRRRGRGRF